MTISVELYRHTTLSHYIANRKYKKNFLYFIPKLFYTQIFPVNF